MEIFKNVILVKCRSGVQIVMGYGDGAYWHEHGIYRILFLKFAVKQWLDIVES